VPIGVGDLREAGVAWERRVTELLNSNPEVGDYVRQLEERDDEDFDDVEGSGERLAEELERFLREQRDT
jgi:hypothetical protein